MNLFVGMIDNEGLEFGLDAVTPVTFKFYERQPKGIRFFWRLPSDIIYTDEFLKFVAQNPTLTMSYNQLRERLSVFRDSI